jgi:quercetin dioxygenase-like cupin family protein
MRVEDGGPLAPRPARARIRGSRAIATEQLVVGEWSLTAAAWTDRHQHEETNWVLEGELRVTCEGRTEIVRPGQAVIISPGARARYEAPVYARMLFVYGPSADGHAMTDGRYEELPCGDPAAETAESSP